MDNDNENMSTSPRISITDSSGSGDDDDEQIIAEPRHQTIYSSGYRLSGDISGQAQANPVPGPSGTRNYQQSQYESWKNIWLRPNNSVTLFNRYRKQPVPVRWSDNRGVQHVTPMFGGVRHNPYYTQRDAVVSMPDSTHARAQLPPATVSTSSDREIFRPYKIRRLSRNTPPVETVDNGDVNGNNVVEEEAPGQGDVQDQIEVSNTRENEAQQKENVTGMTVEVVQEVVAPSTSSENNDKTVKEMPLNQALLTLLECPVCLECMEPPMAQCRRGHLTCHACREKMLRCPVCRASFTSVRNRAMEQVAEKLQYPCRHGCGAVVSLKARGSHEANCARRRYACPLPACRAEPLPHEALINHFLDSHPDVIAFGSKGTFRYCRSSEPHDWIMISIDNIFHVQFYTSTRNHGVHGSVTFIGPKRLASRYRYEITLTGQECSRKLVYTRDTHNDLECRLHLYGQGDAFFVSFDSALSFNKPNFSNALNFKVEVHPNEKVDDGEQAE